MIKESTLSYFTKEVHKAKDAEARSVWFKGSKYGEMLNTIQEEVGENFELDDACLLCNFGFFVSNNSLAANESMHGYDDKIYYEDGACLTMSGLLVHPYEWMESGWYIKASPHEVDFKKLSDMHEQSRGCMIYGSSYEECIIRE